MEEIVLFHLYISLNISTFVAIRSIHSEGAAEMGQGNFVFPGMRKYLNLNN